jgi:hypothetical protein
MKISDQEKRTLSQQLAHVIGKALQQHYEQVNGAWWLFTMGKPARPLAQSEIDWHVARNHKPFVENGISEDHPDWWKDPQ